MPKFISLLLIIFVSTTCTSDLEDRLHLEAAVQAAQWIMAASVETDQGLTWSVVPGEEGMINNTLYSGTPGVILFFLEMYHTTGQTSYLQAAMDGADYLLETLSQEKMAGFYAGISGVGFALLETYKASKKLGYLNGATQCLQYLQENAIQADRGVEWGDVTDIISGSAGTGLFLLYAARELDDPEIIELASQTGLRLIDLGQPTENGLKWAMDPEYPRLMPNFSHGTAGIAYFLATLYQVSPHREFLDAAQAGARYLQSIANTEGDACLIFHNEPDGEDLYYLGWCHGPVGTARLFYRLYQITEDTAYLDWVKRGAKALLDSGIPEKQTPGFWNNVGVCCGTAGVADFMLSLCEVMPVIEYLDFVYRLNQQLMHSATRDATGLYWLQAEHRSRPDFLQAQTGLMQGAAGIGLWLLHLDAFEQSRSLSIRFPDSPF